MTKYTEAQRISFNHGHHDGANIERLGVEYRRMWKKGKHFDRFYEAGYWSGVEAQKAGTYNENSDYAWQEHTAYQDDQEKYRIFPKKVKRAKRKTSTRQ